jgi:predicted restriction endonuclease
LALQQARIGQGPFRTSLIVRWNRCPLTGIEDPALLRASHIVAWTASGDEERRDPRNGLLLSALWDAAFDRGLVTFADDGEAVFSRKLTEKAAEALRVQGKTRVDGLCEGNRKRLAVHRKFFETGGWPTP